MGLLARARAARPKLTPGGGSAFAVGDRVKWTAGDRWDYKKEGVAVSKITGRVVEVVDNPGAVAYLGGPALKVLPDHRTKSGPFEGVCTYVMCSVCERVK